MMAGGATLAVTGVSATVTTAGVAVVVAGPVAAAGAEIAATGFAAATTGTIMMANSAANQGQGYERGKSKSDFRGENHSQNAKGNRLWEHFLL